MQAHPSYGVGRLYCDLCCRWDENDHDKSETHITRLKKIIQTGWSVDRAQAAAAYRHDKGIWPPAPPAPVSPSDSSSEDSQPAHARAAADRRRQLDKAENEAEAERTLALARQQATAARLTTAGASVGQTGAKPPAMSPPPGSPPKAKQTGVIDLSAIVDDPTGATPPSPSARHAPATSSTATLVSILADTARQVIARTNAEAAAPAADADDSDATSTLFRPTAADGTAATTANVPIDTAAPQAPPPSRGGAACYRTAKVP